jgi:hypothetical protein
VQSYIVRVYRRDPDNKDKVAGIIEKVGTQNQKSFLNISGLEESLKHFIKSDDIDYPEAKQIDMHGHSEIHINAIQARMKNNAKVQ